MNYDLAFLAILLAGGSGFSCARHRCPVHPIRGCPCGEENPALDAAADLSVILTWWQLRDGVTDHGFFGGLKYRLAALLLRRSYRKAARLRPDFDRLVQGCLGELAALERENCPSIDRPADTFARLLAGAAGEEPDPVRRRVLAQLLYHLGRWIYLTDAADDLAKDQRSGSYNPLPLRFSMQEGKLTEESRQELAQTMDRSVERTLDDSANRRIALPEGFLCADAILRLCQNVASGLRVNETVVDRTLREYLPFMATENLMMEAVKRGGDRQQLHEVIRRHSMAATARMKEGHPCDLLDRLAADPAFGLTRPELEALMDPQRYIGRCPQQVARFLERCQPLLAQAQTADGTITL